MSDVEEEKWVVCEDVPNYDVSNFGNVRRNEKGPGARVGKILKYCLTGHGYPTIKLGKGKEWKNYMIHTLVAKAFIGPRPEGYTIDHNDRNKLNNRANNLSYMTNEDNIKKGFAEGAYPKGENRWNGKLTKETTEAIRADIAKGDTPQYKIAEKYGVSKQLVSLVKQKKSCY